MYLVSQSIIKSAKTKLTQYFLPIVLTVFFVICLLNVNAASLWRDEAFSAMMAGLPVSELIANTAQDNSPPLYLLILKFTISIFGNSAIVMRSLSILAGLVALYFSYKIALLYFGNTKAARYSLLLIALGPETFYYALEARPYMMVIACSLITLYIGWLYMLKPSRFKFIGLILFSSIGMYLHNIFAFMLVAVFSWMLLLRLKNNWPINFKTLIVKNLDLLFLGLAIIFVYLPWAAVLKNQIAGLSQNGFWLDFDPGALLGPAIAPAIMGQVSPIYQFPFLKPAWLFIAYFIVFTFIKGWWDEIRSSKTKLPLLTIATILPMLMVYLVSFKVPLMYIRYLIFIVPFAFMLVVLAWQKYTKVLLAFILVVILISGYGFKAWPHVKEDYPAMVRKVDFKANTDVVFVANALPFFGLKYYTSWPTYVYNDPANIKQYEGKAYLRPADYWQGDLTKIQRVWLPYFGERDIAELKQKLVNAGFHEVRQTEISDAFYLSEFIR